MGMNIDASKTCSCCGALDDIQMHHLYPKSLGCPDSLMVPLCFACHRNAHGLTASISHSELTRAGLAAAKSRGIKLGGSRIGTAEDCAKATAARMAKAQARAERLRVLLQHIDPEGTMALNALSRLLNEERVPTPSGRGQWAAQMVKRIRARLSLA